MTPARPCPDCGVAMTELRRDENKDRIRTLESCPTHGEHYGCFAKRLDDEGRTAWGVPNVWHFSKPQREVSR
jgi:hypothetical protein